MTTAKTLGERLRLARLLADISARDLDRLAGRPEGHSTVIEARDDAPVRTDTAEHYADALGVTLDWLVRGIGPEPTRAQVVAAVEKARSRQQVA